MRLIFAGTPEVALPSLEFLSSRHEIVAVLTRAPAPHGRKRVLTPSPVHVYAQSQGIPVLTPATLKDPDVVDTLCELNAEAGAVVAYGLFIPEAALNVTTHGWFNLHFSALPRWRGAAPVQYALAAGDTSIGTSVFKIGKGLDTGPVVSTLMHSLDSDATAGEVLEDLAQRGAPQLHHALIDVASGCAVLTEQEGDVSYAPTLSTKDSRLDWTAPAHTLVNAVRAFTPEPGAWTTFSGQRMKISQLTLAECEDGEVKQLLPGRISVINKRVVVGTGTLPVELGSVTPAGKKTMDAQSWVRGLHATEISFDNNVEKGTHE